jgi:uncharacterized RDD family membrane protein YckC
MQDWLDERPQPAGFCDGCGTVLTSADRFCTSCGRPAVRDGSETYRRGTVAGKPIAGFGFRVGVYLVDGIILSTIFGIGGQFLGDSLVDSTTEDLEALNARQQAGDVVTVSEFFDVLMPALIFYAIYFVVTGLLLPWLWNSLGWSPAKRIIGLRIVDAAGNPPGWRRGLGRTAASFLSAMTLGLGYLAAAWHPEKRTWHDRMAGTWVVDVRTDRN